MIVRQKTEAIRRIAAVVLFILGLSIIIYPFAAQHINNRFATRLVEDYFEQNAKGKGDNRQDADGQGASDNASIEGENTGNRGDTSKSSEYEEGIFGSIRIPKLGIELPIFTGSTNANLNRGVAHLEGTSLPVGGKSTHSVLCGHSGNVTNEWFTHIGELTEGDLFYIRTRDQTLTYKVIAKKTIDPNDISELVIRPEEDLVTLLTCAQGGRMRLIVTGERI